MSVPDGDGVEFGEPPFSGPKTKPKTAEPTTTVEDSAGSSGYSVVIGVDVSLTGTGMAWLESPSGESLTHRIVSLPRAGADDSHRAVGVIPKGEVIPIGVRLDRLYSDVTIAVGDLWNPKPMLAVVESGFSGGQGPAATKLGMASGIVITALTRLYIPVVMVPPKRRAKFATGDGNADKEAVLKAAVEQFDYKTIQGVYPKPASMAQAVWALNYDRADALVLAVMGACLIGDSFEVPGLHIFPEQWEVIDAMDAWQAHGFSDVSIDLGDEEDPI